MKKTKAWKLHQTLPNCKEVEARFPGTEIIKGNLDRELGGYRMSYRLPNSDRDLSEAEFMSLWNDGRDFYIEKNVDGEW